MYKAIRFIFFLFSPEKAHYLAMDLLNIALKIPGLNSWLHSSFKPKNAHPVEFLGISFPNAVGLAAGFDKNARWLRLLKALGFGHVEVGTVTPKPQDGNPKPRLFRLKPDLALINRMGFNNEGVDAMVERLKKRPKGLIVGGNIGKNKVTPNEQAIDDYLHCFEKLYPWVDYLVVNVSSPNTPGLRELQDKAFLGNLFDTLHDMRNRYEVQKPILLKIAPDLAQEGLDEIIETVKQHHIEGLIATNTTISRDGLKTRKTELETIGAGGLSGKPVFDRSNEVLRYLRQHLGDQYPLVGVGGVFTAEDRRKKQQDGAQLVQIYTGFIYQGPWIVKDLLD
ncbi:MAG: quinone-dependent dihydroorotate dehydrogenase [Bacteroidetes bacterium]|nr:quinone-dependent dihydroorotate dehydrogenase [Bacteroidota bacterium]